MLLWSAGMPCSVRKASKGESKYQPTAQVMMAGSKCPHLNKGGLGLHTKASYQGRVSPLPDLQHFQKADEFDLRKRARIVAQVVVGTDPVWMLTGPIAATRKVVAKAK